MPESNPNILDPTLIRDVSAETWERMLVEITLGQKPEANNAAERRVRDLLTRDVEEIRRKGGIVEIPHDIP
jgi:hypothetical protein